MHPFLNQSRTTVSTVEATKVSPLETTQRASVLFGNMANPARIGWAPTFRGLDCRGRFRPSITSSVFERCTTAKGAPLDAMKGICRMVRPRKLADEKLSEHVHFLTTIATRETLAQRARAAGVNEGEFLRRYIDGKPNEAPALSAMVDPALIAAVNNFCVGLSKIGNNVNQLAAASHQGREFTKYYREIGQELEGELLAGRTLLQKLLEAAEA